jgi:type I site-specific restriction endonuclease
MALKAISSKVDGVKKVVVFCKNHIMAERINEEVNR